MAQQLKVIVLITSVDPWGPQSRMREPTPAICSLSSRCNDTHPCDHRCVYKHTDYKLAMKIKTRETSSSSARLEKHPMSYSSLESTGLFVGWLIL